MIFLQSGDWIATSVSDHSDDSGASDGVHNVFSSDYLIPTCTIIMTSVFLGQVSLLSFIEENALHVRLYANFTI